MWWVLSFVIVAFLGALAPTAAVAQEAEELFEVLTQEDQILVLDLIDEGTEAYDDGEFQRALEYFEATYRLFPHPDVLYRLALCHERLGNDADAIQHYRLFLSAVPDARERGRVERTIALLEERLGEPVGELRVETTPAGAAVSLSEPRPQELGESPVQVELTPGSYTLRIELEGFEAQEEQIRIVRGKSVVLRQDLTPLKVEEAVQGRSRWTLWEPALSLALVGLGAVTAMQATLASQDEREETRRYEVWKLGKSEIDRFQGEEREAEFVEQINIYKREKIGMAITSGVSFAGAALLLGWWLFRSDDEERVALSIQPSTDSAVISLSGRF